tara:strand:+ start:4042 stop:4479 length:438 start_codon:yes stop_codon:yes gene_type:complete
MLTYFILTGIIVFGFAFAMWLGTFLLNRSINTTLETEDEARHNVAGQLGYGTLLLGATIILTVVFFQMDRAPIIPPMPPGLQPEGIRREAEAEKKDTKAIVPESKKEAAPPAPVNGAPEVTPPTDIKPAEPKEAIQPEASSALSV